MPFPSSLNRDEDSMEEIPVTNTPIFEGHLSVRSEKKQWQWRLFRFDGSNFTCLSTRKVKLQANDGTAYPNLISTPKDKNKRLVQTTDNKIELKYYQLPEWTIDVANISAISVLKRVKKNNLTTPSKCFSIRTFQNQHFILKAQKQKDLERWLFVLTKMWKFTQAVKEKVQQHYYNQQQIQQQQQQVVQEEEDNIPLVHSVTTPPTCYNNSNNRPALSNEKIKVIDEWRKSLAELMANDPSIKASTPPPIESIPDDDTMSIFTDITSVSHHRPLQPQPKIIKRVKTKSIRRTKTNSISPQLQQQQQQQQQGQEITAAIGLEGRPVPTLRKRRSDDVRNWMNNKKGIDMMSFFQDVGASSVYEDNNNNNNSPILKYHTSIRELIKRTRRASIPLLTNDILHQQSPLQYLTMKRNQEEEEMSLADLQKSLRQVSLHHHHHQRSPSVSSIQDLQKRNTFSNIVAPAIPPFHHHHHQQQQQQQHHYYI
ncbi:hypothetical protein BD770DRAFT_33632 [Pilaira anomala]|nr:hypothetical protein BD770DRAFT_33632 [Pilaira anomala]